ncbi:hypothetical protein VNO78_23389 [Psophocarpus tetragonolobus]|uniref:Uncharacterized protein n=1 Tax=Psophocarpus tetragonolobus TaxID=3891 RepID=A0AAN9S3G0_PSOTE
MALSSHPLIFFHHFLYAPLGFLTLLTPIFSLSRASLSSPSASFSRHPLLLHHPLRPPPLLLFLLLLLLLLLQNPSPCVLLLLPCPSVVVIEEHHLRCS